MSTGRWVLRLFHQIKLWHTTFITPIISKRMSHTNILAGGFIEKTSRILWKTATFHRKAECLISNTRHLKFWARGFAKLSSTSAWKFHCINNIHALETGRCSGFFLRLLLQQNVRRTESKHTVRGWQHCHLPWGVAGASTEMIQLLPAANKGFLLLFLQPSPVWIKTEIYDNGP